MPEFTYTTHKTDEIEIICLFKSQELKNKFIEKSIDKEIDLDKTVKEMRTEKLIRQTKDIKMSGGLHHLIF